MVCVDRRIGPAPPRALASAFQRRARFSLSSSRRVRADAATMRMQARGRSRAQFGMPSRRRYRAGQAYFARCLRLLLLGRIRRHAIADDADMLRPQQC